MSTERHTHSPEPAPTADGPGQQSRRRCWPSSCEVAAQRHRAWPRSPALACNQHVPSKPTRSSLSLSLPNQYHSPSRRRLCRTTRERRRQAGGQQMQPAKPALARRTSSCSSSTTSTTTTPPPCSLHPRPQASVRGLAAVRPVPATRNDYQTGGIRTVPVHRRPIHGGR